MVDVRHVADQVLSHFKYPISTMKLQKLCYIAHGWSLAISDEPLVDDGFEAWANGPVSRKLFRAHAYQGSVDSITGGDRNMLTMAQRATIDGVVLAYAGLSAQQLSDKTHQPGTPWTEARQGLPAGTRSSRPLSDESIKKHFKELLKVRD
jgi:uncharacterized phage-associated protein